jgi:hypothetical protein
VNRAALRAELQATGFGGSTAEQIRLNNWLDAAYTYVWNEGDWSFKKVDQAILAVSGASPTMPADFGTVDYIEDNFGALLEQLEPERFDAYFQPIPNPVTGPPWSYKVVNRQVVFGPAPTGAVNFKWSYTRRVVHLDNALATQPGTLGADTDSPFWPVDHHMVLVYAAALIGHSMNSNPFGQGFAALRDDALRAMREDLEVELAPGLQWGSAWGGIDY